jgi:hypothetical protein
VGEDVNVHSLRVRKTAAILWDSKRCNRGPLSTAAPPDTPTHRAPAAGARSGGSRICIRAVEPRRVTGISVEDGHTDSAARWRGRHRADRQTTPAIRGKSRPPPVLYGRAPVAAARPVPLSTKTGPYDRAADDHYGGRPGRCLHRRSRVLRQTDHFRMKRLPQTVVRREEAISTGQWKAGHLMTQWRLLRLT